MKPVYQTITTVPGGNCFAACVASILEVGLLAVPNFQGADWHARWQAWLAHYNAQFLTVAHDPQHPIRGYAVGIIASPRGDFMHAVVQKDGTTVHDPYPVRLRKPILPTTPPMPRREPVPAEVTILHPIDPTKRMGPFPKGMLAVHKPWVTADGRFRKAAPDLARLLGLTTHLSRQQYLILVSMAEGLSYHEAGKRVGLDTGNVFNQLRRLKDRLDVDTTEELLSWWLAERDRWQVYRQLAEQTAARKPRRGPDADHEYRHEVASD